MTSPKVPWWSGDIRNFSDEEFQGYFNEIRLVAMKTLPRQPPKGILALLRMDKLSGVRRNSNQEISPSPRLFDTQPFTYSPRDLQLDLQDTISTTDASCNYFPVSARARLHKWDQNDGGEEKKGNACTRVEKALFGISAYLGVAILVLIIVVGALVTSLQGIDDNINNLKEMTELQAGSQNSPNDAPVSSTSAISLISVAKGQATAIPISSTSLKTTLTSTLKTSTTPQPTTSIQTKEASTTSEPTTLTIKSLSSFKFTTRLETVGTSRVPTTTSTTKPSTTEPRSTTSKVISTKTPTTPSTLTTTEQLTTTETQTTVTPKTTTTPKSTTPELTTTPKPTTTTPKPTTTTIEPTTTPRPTTPTTTTTPKPTTTPRPTTTTPRPTTTTPEPTTTPRPTTTTTTTPKPTTTPEPTTTSTPTTTRPTTTTQTPTTTPQPTTTIATTTTIPLTTTTESSLCETDRCNSLAYEILSRINSTINPCSDFYRYACGAWITSRQLLIEQELIDTSRTSILEDHRQILRRRIKDMLEEPVLQSDSTYLSAIKLHHQSCLESNNKPDDNTVTEDATLSLEILGMDGSYTSYLTPSYMQMSAKKDLNTDALFSYQIVQAKVGADKYNMLQLSPPPLFLKKSDYDDPFSSNTVANIYIDNLARIIQRFISTGGDIQRRSLRNVHRFQKRRLLQDGIDPVLQSLLLDMFKFERQLAQSISATTTDPPEIIQIDLAELSQRYPNIDWSQALPTQQSDSFPVRLSSPSFFYSLDRLFSQTSGNVINMYIYTRAILFGVWPYLPLETRSLTDGLGSVNVSAAFTWQDCLNSTIHILSEEVQNEITLKYSNTVAVAKEFLGPLYQNLTRELRKSFKEAQGYSDETKASVEARLQSLTTKFQPIPDIQWTVTLSTSSSVSFTSRALFGLQARMSRDMDKIGQLLQFPNNEWYSLLPMYDSDINVLGIPTGLILDFNELLPQFPIFANAGWMFGEEASHAIFGTMTDNFPPSFWSSLSGFSYLQVQTCYANQLSEPDTEDGYFRTGKVKSGQAGLRIAKQEYDRLVLAGQITKRILPRVSFTEDQLFYLSFVQNLCELSNGDAPISNHYRRLAYKLHFMMGEKVPPSPPPEGMTEDSMVNNILRNDDNFGAVFQCQEGSIMSPVQKCSLL